MGAAPPADNIITVRPARRRAEVLPHNLPPRGLKREQAAAYIGVSPTKFDEMVRDGRMPKPKRIDGLTSWDRKKLDEAYEALPDDGGKAGGDRNPWDD